MANEKRLDLIDRGALMNDISQIGVVSVGNVLQCLSVAKTVDAVEVTDKELRKAIKLLIEQYGHSKASEYVHDPVAHAIYHTWKRVKEKNNGR